MLTSTTQQQLLRPKHKGKQKKQTKTQTVENDPYCRASTTTKEKKKICTILA
jgi:hypothetical protein